MKDSLENYTWVRKRLDTLEGNGSMDAGCDLGLAAKGSAIDLEVAGSGLVSCCFFSFLSLSYHV